jgi:hypothetical protein
MKILTYPAMTTPRRRKTLFAPNAISLESLESTTLKSAVNRLRIRPKGTVSIHRRGVLKIVKLRLSKSFRDARIAPQKTQ